MKKILLNLIYLSLFIACKDENNQNNKKEVFVDSNTIVKTNQSDIFIGKEIGESTEFVNVKVIEFSETEIDSIYYGLYQDNTKNETYIFTIEKELEDPHSKIIDTVNLRTAKIKVKINKLEKKNSLNLFVNNQLIKKWEFKKEYYSNTFLGKFTVSVEGDHANHGIEMYDYEINISENEISLHETNREFCSGRYRGKENNNTLELFYAQDEDERCVNIKPKFTIKKEGEQFYIQGVGGEGTFYEWIELKKVSNNS